MDVEFHKMLFMHLLRWPCDFCLLWCGISHWLICICLTILVNLGWNSLFCGVWSSLCVMWFSLLKFCWELLYLYLLKILACNFLFSWCLWLVLLSGWWWLQRMSLRVFLPFNILEEFEKDHYKLFFVCLVEFAWGVIWSWTSAYREFLNYSFFFTVFLIA